jgi:GNAT acetyltransferase-like protein
MEVLRDEHVRRGAGSWTVRPARDGDVDALTGLHQRVFGRQISREQWRWKLAAGRGPVANVWIAETGGRIIFQYAGIPTRVRHRGTECWAMVSVDTMTDPDFRRRGLLTEVGAATYAHWRQAGIPFVVGLPNEQWGSRTRALGWAPVSEIRPWVRWLAPVATWAARLGFQTRTGPGATTSGRCSPLEVLPVQDPSNFDELWDRACDEGVVHDAAWFRWRYLEAVPRWELLGAWLSGHLVGAAALRLDGKRDPPAGIIGEVLASRWSVLRLLISQSCHRLRSMGASRAVLLIQPGSMLEVAALATGFLPRPWAFSIDAVDLGGGVPRAARFQGGDFDVV